MAVGVAGARQCSAMTATSRSWAELGPGASRRVQRLRLNPALNLLSVPPCAFLCTIENRICRQQTAQAKCRRRICGPGQDHAYMYDSMPCRTERCSAGRGCRQQQGCLTHIGLHKNIQHALGRHRSAQCPGLQRSLHSVLDCNTQVPLQPYSWTACGALCRCWLVLPLRTCCRVFFCQKLSVHGFGQYAVSSRRGVPWNHG